MSSNRNRGGSTDGDGRGSGREAGPTAALFVRIPAEHARRLDRAAFELRVPKQSLVSELVERYVDPECPASLQALAMPGGGGRPATAGARPSVPAGTGSSVSGGARSSVPGGARSSVPGSEPLGASMFGDRERAGRRVTVETLDQGELTVGRHAFRPATAPEVLTAEDAAELLQVPQDVVLGLARAGELPGRELGGEWRFARVALLAWLAAGDANG